jgi:hypothetical protein
MSDSCREETRWPLSAGVDEEWTNVDNQRQALRQVIGRRQGWDIAEEFCDDGVSGAKGRDKRPEFDRLLEEVVRGKIDVVAAWSVDRLGRSLQDLVGFLGELNAAGCDLYLEKQAVDTTTPAGRALFQILGVFAEFERATSRNGSMPGSPGQGRGGPRAAGRSAGRGSTQREKRQSAQRWRAARAFSRPRASAGPVPAWCSGSKSRWRAPSQDSSARQAILI